MVPRVLASSNATWTRSSAASPASCRRPDRDWSEPFALAKNGRYYVFFKEMPRGAGKAHIAMLELSADGRWSAPVRVLERDYHLSHPFVVEHDGQLYLIPESARNRTVEAYRCVDFPLRWRLERVLLDGVRLVDATFYRSAERWWLFANGAAGDGGGFNDELYLFHAPQPARRVAAARAQPGELRRALRAPGRRALLAQRRALPPGADLRAALRRGHHAQPRAAPDPGDLRRAPGGAHRAGGRQRPARHAYREPRRRA